MFLEPSPTLLCVLPKLPIRPYRPVLVFIAPTEGAESDLMGSGPNWSASKKSMPTPPKVRGWEKSISACIWNDML